MKALFILAVLGAMQGCAKPSTERHGISVVGSANSFDVSIAAPELIGLCYAPQSFRANGMLVIDDMLPSGTVIIKRVASGQIEGLNEIVAQPRARVTHASVTLQVPKDIVLKSPFYLQLVLFGCDERPPPESGAKHLYILSAAVQLPIATPSAP